MNDNTDIRQEVDKRFYNLLIGLSNAQDVAGVEIEGKVKAEQSEQLNARRSLLRVEKLAKRDMELNKRSEINYIEGTRDSLNTIIFEKIEKQFLEPEVIQTKVLSMPHSIAELLDSTSVKAASIAKLEPIIEQIPWLASDLLKLVNTPKYRKTDRLGKAIVVENLRMALSFIGMENLKMVIPSMTFKRAIPQITDPYPAFKNKVWEHALGSALSSQRIATLYKVNPNHAFVLGMFHELGKLAVTRLYFRVFDEVHLEAQVEAHDKQERELHAALMKIQPTANTLLTLMWQHSVPQSSNIIDYLGMQRVFIANAMQEYASKPPIDNMSPLCKTLFHANGYSKFSMLKRYKLINNEEAKSFIKSLQMPAATFRALQATDIRRLNVAVEEEA